MIKNLETMNLTTDDVWDQRERMGLNKSSKKRRKK